MPGFAKAASLDEVRRNKYVLTPPRYVGTEDVAIDEEPLDAKVARLEAELLAELKKGRELEDVLRSRIEALRP